MDEVRSRRRRWADVDLVVEDVLLRLAVDRHPAVHPRGVEPRVVAVAPVVVARIAGLDARIGLERERAGDVADHLRVVPGRAVVGRDAAPALVVVAAGRPLVVPADQDVPVRRDRERRLPLSAGAGVLVEPDRRAPRHTVVRRRRVVDVTGVGARAVLRVGVVDDPGRPSAHVAPAHMSPVGGEHGGEVAARARAGAGEGGAHRHSGEGGPAVRRVVHLVRARAEATAALVHAGHEHAPVGAGRDLHVSDEGGARVERDRRAPRRSPVARVDDVGTAADPAGDRVVVPGDIAPPVVRAGRGVVDPDRLAVIGRAAVRAGGRGPRRPVRRRPDADPLPAAAGGQEDGDPLRVRGVVDDTWVAVVRLVAGAERMVVRPRRPAVGRIRAARDADRARVPVLGVVVGGDDRVPVRPGLRLGLGHVRVRAFVTRDQVLVHPTQNRGCKLAQDRERAA